MVRALRTFGRTALTMPPPPPNEVPSGLHRALHGLRHSRRRDAEAIHHHYDVSNRFYEMVLGPSMAYTCACYPSDDATLEEAQANKFDLVCRKLGLKPGMRLLDVGCGWGGMVRHAVREYGVTAIGVTLSAQQAAWAQQAIEADGMSDRATVRYQDYREVSESGFDAVSSIGLTEHIGIKNYPSYFGFLYSKLAPGGRLLNHCITRSDNLHPGIKRRGFIDRYVFPDGELAGAGTIIVAMQDAGFEVQHEENLRRHYARTLAGWCQQPRRELGRVRRRDRPAHREGVGSVHGGLATGVRAAADRAAPGARHAHRRGRRPAPADASRLGRVGAGCARAGWRRSATASSPSSSRSWCWS